MKLEHARLCLDLDCRWIFEVKPEASGDVTCPKCGGSTVHPVSGWLDNRVMLKAQTQPTAMPHLPIITRLLVPIEGTNMHDAHLGHCGVE